MRSRWLMTLATSAIFAGTLATASCGGGGSGGPTPSATATPTPASSSPTPSPTPTPHVLNALPSAQNASVGLNALTTFPTLGFQYREVAGPIVVQSGIEIGYDPAKTSITATLPNYSAGYLDFLSTSAGFTTSLLVPTGGIEFRLLQPGSTNPFFALESTGVGGFRRSNRLAIQPIPVEGVVVYGIPTASGAFPSSGTSHYTLYGQALYVEPTEGAIVPEFGGELDVDFAARTVTGRFIFRSTPGYAAGDYGPSSLQGGVLASDGTFTGTVVRSGAPDGTFSGRLTGPQGTEIMFQWTAQYPSHPNGSFLKDTYGVFAGKR